MDWRVLWTILTGLEPPVHYFPPAVAAIALFIIIFFICFVMHRLSEIFSPEPIRIYALDFFKTMAFCTYPFGIIILRKYHGNIGYAICVIPLNTATALLLETGEGSPVGNWLSVVKRDQSLIKCISRIFVQMAGGSAGFRLGKFLMTFDLHPDFEENLSQTTCTTALNVSVTLGLLIELIGTSWDTWFHSQNISKSMVLDKFLKFCSTSLTFCLGASYTGMFMHPAKAFGLTFGCRGITPIQHIIVYCLGPMMGSYIAYTINSRSKLQKSTTKMASHDTKSDSAYESNKSKVRHRKSKQPEN